MVTNRNNNTLETHEKLTLNKDNDIGGSQISVMWECISITIIPLAKQVHLCKLYACLPLLFPSLSSVLIGCILMRSCYVILVQLNLLWILNFSS